MPSLRRESLGRTDASAPGLHMDEADRYGIDKDGKLAAWADVGSRYNRGRRSLSRQTNASQRQMPTTGRCLSVTVRATGTTPHYLPPIARKSIS